MVVFHKDTVSNDLLLDLTDNSIVYFVLATTVACTRDFRVRHMVEVHSINVVADIHELNAYYYGCHTVLTMTDVAYMEHHDDDDYISDNSY